MCIQHAKTLYSFAYRYRGEYSAVIHHSATKYYSWNGAQDELVDCNLYLLQHILLLRRL